MNEGAGRIRNTDFPLLPVQASADARRVDHLTIGVLSITTAITLGILITILIFLGRYRASAKVDRSGADKLPRTAMEVTWIAVPVVIMLGLFFWSSSLYQRLYEPPPGPTDAYVVAKQWMWKIQHANGKREIDELHVPLGRTTRLLMTSQDVIHSFFVPAFRLKQDVLPGRYTGYAFTPTREGTYHLFCSQYCGTLHSGMVGSVIVMKPADYDAWLSGHQGQGGSLAAEGRGLFAKLACATCHRPGAEGRAPHLEGLYGTNVLLSDGRTVRADETYLRESILYPKRKIVAGYQPIMPTFEGQISEEELVRVIEYIKSLKDEPDVLGESALPLNENKIEQMRAGEAPRQ